MDASDINKIYILSRFYLYLIDKTSLLRTVSTNSAFKRAKGSLESKMRQVRIMET